MKKLLVISFLLCLSVCSFSQASNTYSVKFSDALIARYQPTIDNLTGKGWEYSNSIIMHGMEKVYNNVPTAAYLSYIQAYIDTYVTSGGVITGITVNTLDKVHPGISLLFLYQKTGLVKYKTA